MSIYIIHLNNKGEAKEKQHNEMERARFSFSFVHHCHFNVLHAYVSDYLTSITCLCFDYLTSMNQAYAMFRFVFQKQIVA